LYSFVLVTGGASLLVSLFTLVTLMVRINQLQSVRESMKDNMFGGIAEGMIQSVQIQWGWALLTGGSVGLLFAAWRSISKQRASEVSSAPLPI
jgi:hypothetical protein